MRRAFTLQMYDRLAVDSPIFICAQKPRESVRSPLTRDDVLRHNVTFPNCPFNGIGGCELNCDQWCVAACH